MTLRNLQQRINAVVASNDARAGWSSRNDLEVLISVRRNTKRYKRRFYPTEFLQDGMMRVGSRSFGCAITASEIEEVTA